MKVKEILTFLDRTNELKSVPRFSSSLAHGGDTVAEHSWRLALMVFVISRECKVAIDLPHAIGLALFHDLAEAKTGDIDAYAVMTNKVDREKKIIEEERVMKEMTDDLSFGDWIFQFWRQYENQESIEARFVRALDKIEAFLHIAERGVEAYIPKEFHADYADKAVKSFDETTHHFPELKDMLDAIKKDLKVQFEAAGIAWKE